MSVDVVIPVYGGLRHTRACLASLQRWTDPERYRLIVVDDASDPRSRAAVQELVADGWGERGEVLVNDTNLGFLRTANRGMRAGRSATIALLNSDTLLTPGWLDGLLACLHSASDVGLVSPLSNHANLTRIDVPFGTDHLRIAAALRRVSPRAYPDIGLATGFCMAARRGLLEELDFFDEAYGRGYREETDLCLRAAERGWRTLADDATYVHHHGWGSFGAEERATLMTANARIFEQRWADIHPRVRRRVRRERPFAEHERRLRVALRGHAQVAPRRDLPRSGARGVAEDARLAEATAARPTRPATATRHPLERWQHLADDAAGAGVADRPDGGDDVLVLVDDLDLTPWTTEVLQLVDRLVRDGVAASLATTGAFDPALLSDPARNRPYVLSGPDELLATVPPHRVVLATSPAAVYDALLLRERDGSRVATWFDPQARIPSLGWPGDGWHTAMAPTLATAHLGPAAPTPPPPGALVLPVPLGVDPDVYDRQPLAGRAPAVLLTHARDAGPAVSADVRHVAERLTTAGVEVTVYGDSVGDDRFTVEPFSPQAAEAVLLARHTAVVEVGPIPGLERLRLRCAATGTPLVLASPTAASCPLQVPDQAHAAPRGDVERATELALTIVRDPSTSADRVDAAHRRALDSPLEAEARALADAVSRISRAD